MTDPAVWPLPRGNLEQLRRRTANATIGPQTCADGLCEPMDLGLAVDELRYATFRS